MDSLEVDTLAKVIWDYHHLNHQLKKADCIFVLGSHDTRVADYATDLFLQGYAPYLIFSGGLGNLTTGVFKKSEAEIFADIAKSKGVPEDKILIENKSTNTGENVQFTKQLLKDKELNFNSFILVQKPYMERRTYATFRKQWPEADCIVTSPNLSFETYSTSEHYKNRWIDVMVGDLHRITNHYIYPKKAFKFLKK